MPDDNDDVFRRAMGQLGLDRRGSRIGPRGAPLEGGADLGAGEPSPTTAAAASPPASAIGPPNDDDGDDLERALFAEAIAELAPPPEVDAGDRRDRAPAVPGTSRRRMHGRIKRGAIVAERSLDLHGATRRDAVQQVHRFLSAARAEGVGVVKVITGRGLHSRDGALVRDAVLAALRGDLRDHVYEIVTPPRSHGGEGALILLLRRPAP